ncbi:hypothetical protein N9917_01065 [Deltaproteobacteria bacterium]|nr:hypothetical protein [Deltaproteobacteria bacterium]
MSKKTALDMLGETHLPSDLLVPTEALNGLMDTYPDLDYGAGVLSQFLPESSGHESGLPDGVVKADDEGFGDLGDFMKEGSLADLSWLEVTEQDAERLPESPTDLSIPELEEAWGMDRRTTGVRTTAYDLETTKYHAAAEDTSTGPAVTKDQRRALAKVLRKAMRRSAAGASWADIRREIHASAGMFIDSIAPAVQAIKAEHRLAGEVFIRAEAYPGYTNGKWKKHLKKAAASARYIIVAKGDLDAAHHVQGICTITGKKVVATVPWKAAFSHYAPRLKASGRKVASNPKDPRKALYQSFGMAPVGPKAIEMDRPVHVAPSERVSSKQAKETFAATPADKRKVYNRQAAEARESKVAAARRINAWVSANLIPVRTAKSIVSSGKSAPVMLRQAAAVVLATRGASAFSGLDNDVRPADITLREANEELAKVKAPAPIDISHREADKAKRKAHLYVAKQVKAGALSREDGVRLVKSKAEPRAIKAAADALINSGAQKQGAYSGARNQRTEVEVSRKEALASLELAEKQAAKKQAALDGEVQHREWAASRTGRRIKDLEARCRKVATAVEKGLRGSALAKAIRRSITAEESPAASMMLASILRQKGLSLEAALEGPQKKAAAYEGPKFQPSQLETPEAKPTRKAMTGLLKWALQKMNEGVAGSDLDALMRARFGGPTRKAASADLKELRASHEGLAGHLYVDAAAYASQNGTKGCEKGGLRHRANVVPTVLAMDRCQGCAMRNKKADGTPVCSTYNKPLITAAELPTDDIKAYQKQSIRSADASDAELTASYFAPSYDQSEFSLHNAAGDGIDFSEAPTNEELGHIVFGGMEW